MNSNYVGGPLPNLEIKLINIPEMNYLSKYWDEEWSQLQEEKSAKEANLFFQDTIKNFKKLQKRSIRIEGIIQMYYLFYI